MKPVRLLAAALLIGFTAGAGAQEMPGKEDVARITGGTYAVDPDHSQVVWTVDHMGFSPLTGIFGVASGTLVLDPKKPGEAKLDITIPISSLRVTSDGFAKHLAGPEFFDAEKFPTATFKSTKVTVNDDDATIEGDLTLHGVTKRVTLDAELFGAGVNPMSKVENIGFTASADIKRSDFGMGYAVPVVSDEVELDIVGAFTKQP
ncbi:YceI family protein [Ancylobacter moscoviensis]